MWNKDKKVEFLSKLQTKYGNVVRKKDILAEAEQFGEAIPQWLCKTQNRRP